MTHSLNIPSVSIPCACNGSSTRIDELGMRPMQERVYENRDEQYLLIKSPPASGKSRALMYVALHKLHKQGLKRVIVAVPERSIGASFDSEPLSRTGFWADWVVEPRWNLCNGPDKARVAAVKSFLESEDRVLICTHATFRFAMEQFGAEAFDDCLVAIDEFHHSSVDEDNRLGTHITALIRREKAHILAMTGSYFRGMPAL